MFPSGYSFAPMQKGDIGAAVSVINSTDEDDAEYAEECYKKYGVEGNFILKHEGKVIGVIGYEYADETDASFWLSWTYLLDNYHAKGLGREMLTTVLNDLRSQGARKIFISTSDYRDMEDGRIYQRARNLYKAAGFVEEVRHQDYFSFNESQIMLGLRLSNGSTQQEMEPEGEGIKLTSTFEIEETEGSFVIDWKYSGRKMFTEKDLDKLVKKAEKKGAKRIFISFPSICNTGTGDDAASIVSQYGFYEIGRLEDYFEDGIDECHFGLTIY